MTTEKATEIKTRVVFRKWRSKGESSDGEILALFPDIQEGRDGLIQCFAHIGQHGAADYLTCIMRSDPATEVEYAPLRAELESAPYHYDLKVIKHR